MLTILVFSVVLSNVGAEGMEFHHGTWAEALAHSKESGKLIFLDAFTSWCGPCKKMSASTFPQKEVGEFYNPNFINVKIDMEKGDGLMLAGKYSVNAYPTLLYIDGEGKLVHKVIGYMDPEKFISAGKVALKKNDKTALYAKEYDSGKRDFATVYNYVRSLNQSGKSSLKIANEYLNGQKDLTTPENLKFIYEATVESDSRVFDLFLKNKDKMISLVGADGFQSKIIAACNKTVQKAIEYKVVDLLTASQEKIQTLLPVESDKFNFESNLTYYSAMQDADGLLKAMKKLPASVEKDASLMHTLALSIEDKFASDTKLLSLGEQLLSKVVSSTDLNQSYTLARLYALNNKVDKASKLLDEVIEQAKAKNVDTMEMEQFKLKIQRS